MCANRGDDMYDSTRFGVAYSTWLESTRKRTDGEQQARISIQRRVRAGRGKEGAGRAEEAGRDWDLKPTYTTTITGPTTQHLE